MSIDVYEFCEAACPGNAVSLERAIRAVIADERQPEPPTTKRNGHDYYKTGDIGAPDQIKDGNGEVVLSLCRRCGRAEAELDEPCTDPEPRDVPEEQMPEYVRAAAADCWGGGTRADYRKKIYKNCEAEIARRVEKATNHEVRECAEAIKKAIAERDKAKAETERYRQLAKGFEERLDQCRNQICQSGNGVSEGSPEYAIGSLVQKLYDAAGVPTGSGAIVDVVSGLRQQLAERDEANEVNSKWIWRIGDAVGCDGSWVECLTAIIALRKERDEAAADGARRERERIVAWLRKEIETESIVETARAAWAYANAIERCEHADAIAAGEEPTA